VELLAQTLAQTAQDTARQQALERGASLMLVVIGLGVAVFTGLCVYAILRRRRQSAPGAAPKPSRNLDAWGAAADRVEYERRADQYEDDDTDTDADESTWYDEGPDDDDSSWSSPPPPDSPPPDAPGPDGPDDDDSFAGDDIPGKRLDF